MRLSFKIHHMYESGYKFVESNSVVSTFRSFILVKKYCEFQLFPTTGIGTSCSAELEVFLCLK